MNIDQALAQIISYSIAHGVDSLSGIESMVKHYKTLPARQQEAVTVFMTETREPA
jgi:hypothetical protein